MSGVGCAACGEEIAERSEKRRRCRETELELRFSAVEIGDERAGLGGDERAGSVVPGLEATLPIGIDATTCDRAEIDRSGTHASDVADAGDDPSEDRRLAFAPVGFVGKTGSDESLPQIDFGGRSDGRPVAERTASEDRREDLAVKRIVDNSDDGRPVDLDGDGHRETRMAIEVIGGAVDGIDHPADSARSGPVGSLLAQDSVIGSHTKDPVDDELLGRTVDLGDHVGQGRLGVDDDAGSGESVEKEIGGRRREFDRKCEEFVGRLDRHVTQRTLGCRRTPPDGGGVRRRVSMASGSACLIVRHSPMARKVSTTTTAVPPAAMRAPSTAPMPVQMEESPVVWRSANANPMVPPAAPAIRIARKASTLAPTDGSAVREVGADGALGTAPESGVSDCGITPIVWCGEPVRALGVVPPSTVADVKPLVILPTYNEAENITEVLERARQAVPGIDILVVDDGSPDGTADIAEQWASENGGALTVLRRGAKAGLGSAYRAGFAQGLERGFDALIEMDSDLSHDPAALPSLISAVQSGADLAIGSRYVPGGEIPDWPKHREWLSRGGNRYAALLLRLQVRDATAGFRCYAAPMLARIPLDSVTADGYGFQIEMAYNIARRGGRIVEVPISFTDRVRGTSKMSGRIVFEALALVTWWAVRDRILHRRRPLLDA